MSQTNKIKTAVLAICALFYVSEALSATINQKITPKNNPISIRSCAAPTCSVVQSIPVGATGSVTSVSGNWIKVSWDGYSEGWLVNNEALDQKKVTHILSPYDSIQQTIGSRT